MKKELQNQRAVSREISLVCRDVFKSLVPDVRRARFRRECFAGEDGGMDANDTEFFVIRAIENPDPTALWQRFRRSPKVIVCEFFRRWRLEARHIDTLRVHARHHVFDRAVLPRRIHALKNDQHRTLTLRVKHILQRCESLDIGTQLALGIRLLFEFAGRTRVEVP